jgi:hypothetical protein
MVILMANTNLDGTLFVETLQVGTLPLFESGQAECQQASTLCLESHHRPQTVTSSSCLHSCGGALGPFL